MAVINAGYRFRARKKKSLSIVKVPKNVREAFNIDIMYKNGMAKLEPGKKNCLYDRCYVFEEVNYINKDDAENEYFTTGEFPAAIVADVATDPNGYCLELGTGRVGTIEVIVTVDGVKKIAYGSVYSFYQFEQPISERLTDSQWRQKLGMELNDDGTYNFDRSTMPKQEDWSSSYRYEWEY